MKIEIRNNSMILSGYVNAIARDSREIMNGSKRFVEQVLPNTFERAIKRATNIEVLFNHNQERKLGSISDGNLTLKEDAIGLHATVEVTDPEVIETAKANKLTGWSFGFSAIRDKWEAGVPQRRYLEDIDLYEISVLSVTPAYYGTSLESRNADGRTIELRDCEAEVEVIPEQEERELPLGLQISVLELSVIKQSEEVRRAEFTLGLSPNSLVFESVVKREKDKLSELNEEYRQLKKQSEEKIMVENRELNTTSNMALGTQVTGIVKKSEVKSSVFEKAQKVKMTTEEIRVPIEQDSEDAQFVAEDEDIPEINLTLNNFIDLKQKRVGAAVSLSRKLMYENGTDLSEYAKNLLLRKTEKRLERSILSGSSENEFKGIVTDEMVNSIEMPANPTVAGLRKLFTSVKNEFVKNSVFYVEEKFFEKVAELKTDDGSYLVKEIAVGNEVVQSIFGRPVEVTDSLPSNKPIVFGSIEDSYTIGVNSDLTVRPITDDARYALSGKAGFIAEFYGDGAVTNYQAVCKAVVL